MKPCIHGDVCRAYMRKFGLIRMKNEFGQKYWGLCILSNKCPCCPHYEPKESRNREENVWRR